ncbi:patatin-like phospholipase family protein [Chloroflexota bacterium]
MPRRKIGLALSGGAARGLAHIGVLEVLEKEGIPIDMIAGTSTGAIIGALYAQGKNSSQIANLALGLSWKKLASMVDISLPRSGFLKGKKIKDLLALSLGGDIQFSDLKIPFACVATDIDTGEEVVIDHGSVLEAIRASISLPAVFTVVKLGKRYLVDGGLVNPVPVSVVKRMGADFIIAVNVIPDATDRTHHRASEKNTKGLKEPSIFHVLMQSTYIGTYLLVRSSMEEADAIIEPSVAHINSGDFTHIQECILQGELATREAIPEIKRQLRI